MSGSSRLSPILYRRPSSQRLPSCVVFASILAGSAFLLVAAGGRSRERALNGFRQQNAHVNYVYGACDNNSMDCSCFIQKVYRQIFHRRIPRATLTQEQWLRQHRIHGIKLPQDLKEASLCPGDLIYTYQGKSWQSGSRHVVVYQGKGQVLHSSKSRGGVGTDALAWVRKYRLKGVYRPLGCLQSRDPYQSSDGAKKAVLDDRAVRRLIQNYFRSLETRDLGDYRRVWGPAARRWSEGRTLELPEILRERQLELQGLRKASASYRIESLAVLSDRAFVEVRVSLDLVYNLHRRQEEDAGESFILAKRAGRWRIVYNDDSAAN